MNKLKVLDLFSGIGGFSLGLERTGGFETVAFCEIEEYPRRVLAKHWKGVPIYEDVRLVTEKKLKSDGISVDIITGGFPCQDLSAAGRQSGIEGERSGLWGEVARLIDEIRPKYAILENVSDLLAGPSKSGKWFCRVLGDLAEVGYDAEWHCIPASSIGAPHFRDRAWIVSYPNQVGTEICDKQEPRRPLSWNWVDSLARISGRAQPHLVRMGNGFPDDVDRIGALGNAVVPQIPEIIGHAILHAEGRA